MKQYYNIAFDSGSKGTRYIDNEDSRYGVESQENAKGFESEHEALLYIMSKSYSNVWVEKFPNPLEFTVNNDTFLIHKSFSGCYAKYWNQGTLMKHSSTEPENFDPDSISEEWEHLETIEDFIYFVENVPNGGAYAPGNWEQNKKYFILNEAIQLIGD